VHSGCQLRPSTSSWSHLPTGIDNTGPIYLCFLSSLPHNTSPPVTTAVFGSFLSSLYYKLTLHIGGAGLPILMIRKVSWDPKKDGLLAQSRQSARRFLQSSELGHPHSLNRKRVCPPPPPHWFRGDTLAWEWGGTNSEDGTCTLVL
jgi:hypothetical protein